MNKYDFKINFRHVKGTLDVGAETEDAAYEDVMYIIGQRLADAFPELDIEYDVELDEVWEGGDPDEKYQEVSDMRWMF